MKKVALLGSRDISVEILKWIVEQNDCEVVGVVAPPFKGWWNDKLKETSINLGIKTFDDIQDVIDLNPELIFNNSWKAPLRAGSWSGAACTRLS